MNCSVEMTKRLCKNPRAAGMVNGILRSVERNLDHLPAIPNTDPVSYLSILYSHPEWLVKEFCMTLGENEGAKLLDADNHQPPMTVMVNTLRGTAEQVAQRLTEQRVEVTPHPWLADCLILSKTGDLEGLEAFREGLFYVQDPASRLAVEAAEVRPGMRVLDCCAAPGGKSFAAAMDLKNRGRVVSCDIHPHKLKLIQKGAERLGVSIVEACQADGKVFQPRWEGKFQRVIADVPCSGLGIIRKKPDIRYKDPKPLEGLPQVQGAILDNVSRYVAPGGVLLYSTCTLLERENGGVVDGFLARHPQFRPEAFTLPGPAGRVESGRLTLWPHVHGTDGFYIARLRRKEADL